MEKPDKKQKLREAIEFQQEINDWVTTPMKERMDRWANGILDGDIILPPPTFEKRF